MADVDAASGILAGLWDLSRDRSQDPDAGDEDGKGGAWTLRSELLGAFADRLPWSAGNQHSNQHSGAASSKKPSQSQNQLPSLANLWGNPGQNLDREFINSLHRVNSNLDAMGWTLADLFDDGPLPPPNSQAAYTPYQAMPDDNVTELSDSSAEWVWSTEQVTATVAAMAPLAEQVIGIDAETITTYWGHAVDFYEELNETYQASLPDPKGDPKGDCSARPNVDVNADADDTTTAPANIHAQHETGDAPDHSAPSLQELYKAEPDLHRQAHTYPPDF